MITSVLSLLFTNGLSLSVIYAGRPEVKHEERLSITTEILEIMIRANTPMTILDARTGSHDDGRRIPGAVQMAPNAAADAIARVIGSKDRLVVAYCKDPQCPNYAILASHLRELGYRNVLENPEGIEGWAKAHPAMANHKK